MKFEIHVSSEDQEYNLQQAQSLKAWLLDEEINDLEVSLKQKEIKEGEAGVDWEGILELILPGKALTKIAESISVFFKERTKQKALQVPKLELDVKLKDEQGKVKQEIHLKAENISDIKAILETFSDGGSQTHSLPEPQTPHSLPEPKTSHSLPKP